MRIVTVKLPETYIEAIDELVRSGKYSTRSEVIRTAIRDLLKKELWSSGYVVDVKAKKERRTRIIEVPDEV